MAKETKQELNQGPATPGTAAEMPLAEVEAGIALQARAEAAWEAAWDRAHKADVRAGRPYNRHVYADRAHKARVKVLGVCQRKSCPTHKSAP